MNRAQRFVILVSKTEERRKRERKGRWSLKEMEEVYDKGGHQELSKVSEAVGCR